MKQLLITTFCLTHFFSISPMHLILRQPAHSTRLSRTGVSFYSTPVNNKKRSVFQIMRENKQNILNNIASVSNIVAAGLTSYPLLLLPIASQQLQEAVNYSHKQIALQRNDSQATRDFDLFIKTNSYIIDDIKRIEVITERIEVLQNSYREANQQLIIDGSATLYAQQYKKGISELEKQKRCYEQGVITVMAPFFRIYRCLDISTFLNDNKKQLKQLEKLSVCARGSQLCSLPLATLPLMFRGIDDAKFKNFFDSFAASFGLTLCTIPYLALMILPVEGMPLSIQMSYWISLLLSIKAAYNNTDASLALKNKIYDQGINLEHAIKILELQQVHLQETQSK